MRFLSRQLHSLEDAQLNFEQIEQQGIFTGIGAPTFQAQKGNVYFRKDTPGVANQWLYKNTADGSNWVGVL